MPLPHDEPRFCLAGSYARFQDLTPVTCRQTKHYRPSITDHKRYRPTECLSSRLNAAIQRIQRRMGPTAFLTHGAGGSAQTKKSNGLGPAFNFLSSGEPLRFPFLRRPTIPVISFPPESGDPLKFPFLRRPTSISFPPDERKLKAGVYTPRDRRSSSFL